MIRNVRRYVLGVLLTLCVFGGSGRECEAQSVSETDAEKVAQYLEEAQTRFENQEFSTSFELYQRILVLAPTNRTAYKKISEIIDIYKTLEELARREEELEKAELLSQQQRDIIRYLMKTLTAQLDSSTQKYRQYKITEKEGQDVAESIVPVLENILVVLDELKRLYEGEPGDKKRTKLVVERIARTREDYEKELKFYSERE